MRPPHIHLRLLGSMLRREDCVHKITMLNWTTGAGIHALWQDVNSRAVQAFRALTICSYTGSETTVLRYAHHRSLPIMRRFEGGAYAYDLHKLTTSVYTTAIRNLALTFPLGSTAHDHSLILILTLLVLTLIGDPSPLRRVCGGAR